VPALAAGIRQAGRESSADGGNCSGNPAAIIGKSRLQSAKVLVKSRQAGQVACSTVGISLCVLQGCQHSRQGFKLFLSKAATTRITAGITPAAGISATVAQTGLGTGADPFRAIACLVIVA
jgi:hypothetical protein